MVQKLVFQSICFDTRRMSAGAGNDPITFFTGDPSPHRDESGVASVGEQAITQWLFRQPAPRSLLLSALGIQPHATLHAGVTTPLIEPSRSKPGDIDLVAFELMKPGEATAVEVKRVKVTTYSDRDDHVNKIRGLDKGVDQASALASLGFHRCYYAIVLQVDGWRRTDFNVLFRGASPQTLERVYDCPRMDRLDTDVGVVLIEVVQPTGASHDQMAMVGVCVMRGATPRDQPEQVTRRVLTLANRPDRL